jgi:hypothetical protein
MIVRLQSIDYKKGVGFYWYVEAKNLWCHSVVYDNKRAAVDAMIKNKIEWVERRIK